MQRMRTGALVGSSPSTAVMFINGSPNPRYCSGIPVWFCAMRGTDSRQQTKYNRVLFTLLPFHLRYYYNDILWGIIICDGRNAWFRGNDTAFSQTDKEIRVPSSPNFPWLYPLHHTKQAAGLIFVCYFVLTPSLYLRWKIEELTENYRRTNEEVTEKYRISLLFGGFFSTAYMPICFCWKSPWIKGLMHFGAYTKPTRSLHKMWPKGGSQQPICLSAKSLLYACFEIL